MSAGSCRVAMRAVIECAFSPQARAFVASVRNSTMGTTRFMALPPCRTMMLIVTRRQAFAASSSRIAPLSGLAFEDLPHRLDRVGLRGGLVRSVALDPRETQREPGGVARARLNVAERDLDDEIRPHVDAPVVARQLELEQAARLPLEHPIGQPLERLAEHHEATLLGITRSEVQVAEPALAAPMPPLGRQDDQVERVSALDLEPALSSVARLIRS